MASGQYGVTFFYRGRLLENNYEMVREMIPKAEVLLSEEKKKIRYVIR